MRAKSFSKTLMATTAILAIYGGIKFTEAVSHHAFTPALAQQVEEAEESDVLLAGEESEEVSPEEDDVYEYDELVQAGGLVNDELNLYLGQQYVTPEVSAAILAEHEALAERERAVEEREALLTVSEARVRHEMKRLVAVRDELAEMFEKRVNLADEDARAMAEKYSQMKHRNAAAILNEMPADLVVDILQNMEDRRSAPILAAMDPAKAGMVTRMIMERSQ